jgi:hypothetical protein
MMLASGPTGEGVALVIGDRAKRIRADRSGLHQHIGALARRHQQTFDAIDLRSSNAIKGNGVQSVLLEGQVKVVLVAGVNNPPALDLAGPHANGRLALSIDREEAWHGFRPDRVIDLDHTAVVEKHLVQEQHMLRGAGDLRDIVEIAFDDQRACHAAGHLDVGAAVVVRMVPIGAPRMITGDGDLDIVTLPGLHRSKNVVGDAGRTDVRPVEVEIRGVEMVRQSHVERHRVQIGRQIVDEADAEGVAGPHAERRAWNRSFVRAQGQAIAADVLVGVADVQGRSQFSVRRAADFRLNEWRAIDEGSPGNAAAPGRGVALHVHPRFAGPSALPNHASRQQPGGEAGAASPQEVAPR